MRPISTFQGYPVTAPLTRPAPKPTLRNTVQFGTAEAITEPEILARVNTIYSARNSLDHKIDQVQVGNFRILLDPTFWKTRDVRILSPSRLAPQTVGLNFVQDGHRGDADYRETLFIELQSPEEALALSEALSNPKTRARISLEVQGPDYVLTIHPPKKPRWKLF